MLDGLGKDFHESSEHAGSYRDCRHWWCRLIKWGVGKSRRVAQRRGFDVSGAGYNIRSERRRPR